MSRKIRRVLSAVILVIASVLLVWALLPNPHQALVQSISPSAARIPSQDQNKSPLTMESREIVLEWPSSLRIGEVDEITLVYKPAKEVLSSQSRFSGASDIYKTYNIMAEARFEVAGVIVVPPNPTRESMPSGQTVKFRWQVKTDQAGVFNGSVWLLLRLLPLDGSPAIEVPVFIRDIKIETTSLFGLNETGAYTAAGSGLLIGLITDFDDVTGLIGKWRRNRAQKITYKV